MLAYANDYDFDYLLGTDSIHAITQGYPGLHNYINTDIGIKLTDIQ